LSEDIIYDYSYELQRKIVAMLIVQGEELVRHGDIVKPEFFSNPMLAVMVKLLVDFFHKYNRSISIVELEEEITLFLESNSKRFDTLEFMKVFGEVLTEVEEGSFEYVQDKIVDFARYQSVQAAILKSASLLKIKRDYEGILREVRKALMIGERSENMGSMYYDGTEERVARRSSGNDRESLCVSTGIAALDRKLGGGLAPGELGILMGPMKRGKTLCAINFAKGALSLGGRNVVHYTLESSEDRTQTLYDAMLSGVERDRLRSCPDEVMGKVKSFFESEVNGRLLVKYFPANSCSAWDIEMHLQKIKLCNDFVPGLLIIDYLGLLKPADYRMMGSDGGKYAAYGIITKELLSLAQRGNYAIWLIHQSTRGSLRKEQVDLDDSGDSIEPMRDADVILTIGQNDVERESDPPRIRLFAAGGREIPSRWAVSLCIDTKKCKIWDPQTMA